LEPDSFGGSGDLSGVARDVCPDCYFGSHPGRPYPAALFAYFFDVKKISVVGMERLGTEDGGRYVHRLNDFPSYSEEEQETLLIVDDVADTGITAEVVRQFYPKAKIVTLSAKPAGRDKVDRYSIVVPQDTWIVFPWAVDSDPD